MDLQVGGSNRAAPRPMPQGRPAVWRAPGSRSWRALRGAAGECGPAHRHQRATANVFAEGRFDRRASATRERGRPRRIQQLTAAGRAASGPGSTALPVADPSRSSGRAGSWASFGTAVADLEVGAGPAGRRAQQASRGGARVDGDGTRRATSLSRRPSAGDSPRQYRGMRGSDVSRTARSWQAECGATARTSSASCAHCRRQPRSAPTSALRGLVWPPTSERVRSSWPPSTTRRSADRRWSSERSGGIAGCESGGTGSAAAATDGQRRAARPASFVPIGERPRASAAAIRASP